MGHGRFFCFIVQFCVKEAPLYVRIVGTLKEERRNDKEIDCPVVPSGDEPAANDKK